MKEEEKKLPRELKGLTEKEIELLYDWFSHKGFDLFIDKVTRSWKNTDASADALAAVNSVDEYTVLKNCLMSAGRYDSFTKMKRFGDMVINFFKKKE